MDIYVKVKKPHNVVESIPSWSSVTRNKSMVLYICVLGFSTRFFSTTVKGHISNLDVRIVWPMCGGGMAEAGEWISIVVPRSL